MTRGSNTDRVYTALIDFLLVLFLIRSNLSNLNGILDNFNDITLKDYFTFLFFKESFTKY